MKGEPAKDGQRFDGKYTSTTGAADVTVFRTITFSPDGIYRRHTVGTTRTEADGPPRTDTLGGVAQREEPGTYELAGYKPTLKTSDGKATRCTFFVEVKGKDRRPA